jgi:2-keto-4-pentenoate hydratase
MGGYGLAPGRGLDDIAAMNPEHFAQAVGRARLAGLPLPPEVLALSLHDPDEGYRLQQGLADWFSAQGRGTLAGYKIGATAAQMREYLGLDQPLCGRLRTSDRFEPGSVIQVPGDTPLGLECELAFTFAEDLPERKAPWTREAVLPLLAGCHAALELAENRYGDIRACPVGVLVGDDVFQRAYVVDKMDAPLPCGTLDLAAIAGRVTVDGQLVQSGRGEAVMGNPLDVIVWLANVSSRIGCPLRRGHIVMTGSMTFIHWLEPSPARVGVEIDGVGAFEVTVARTGQDSRAATSPKPGSSA